VTETIRAKKKPPTNTTKYTSRYTIQRYEEVWKTTNNFKNKEDTIGLSVAANLQILCEERKTFTQKKKNN